MSAPSSAALEHSDQSLFEVGLWIATGGGLTESQP